MNILPFVLALLLAMTLITTTKLATLKTLMTVRAKYLLFMKEAESLEFSQNQIKLYNEKTRSDEDEDTETTEDGKTVPTNKVRANKKLSFYALIKNEKDKESPTYKTVSAITKRLLHILYKDQPFYQNIQEKRHDFLNELLDKLKTYGTEYKDKIENITDLAQVDIHDHELSEVFAKMLEGAIISPELNKTQTEEKSSRDCYPKLNEFTTYDTKIQTIRIYLASPELLMAIFNDENIVDNIIKARKEHHKELKKHSKENLTIPRQVESDKFKAAFEASIPSEFDKSLFNFEVTSTYPK